MKEINNSEEIIYQNNSYNLTQMRKACFILENKEIIHQEYNEVFLKFWLIKRINTPMDRHIVIFDLPYENDPYSENLHVLHIDNHETVNRSMKYEKQYTQEFIKNIYKNKFFEIADFSECTDELKNIIVNEAFSFIEGNDIRSIALKKYFVAIGEEKHFFYAENSEHAIEQALNAEPQYSKADIKLVDLTDYLAI